MADSDTSRFLLDDLDRRPRCNLFPVNKADSWIAGTKSTKLVEGGISETADETQKAVDCLTHDFELKVKSSSDESASNDSVSDVNVIHHSDNDDEMDEHLKDQTTDSEMDEHLKDQITDSEMDEHLKDQITDSDDEEDDEMAEYDNICQVCLKEDHRTLLCPFLDHIPDPKNTKLGPKYIIICKCCHRQDVHSDDDDDWEGQAVFDPLQMIYIRKDSDDSRAQITDIRQAHTLRSIINDDPEYQRPCY